MLQLPIDQIEVGERVRQADPREVALIAASMADVGQINPITVLDLGDAKYRLVAGLHRLQAAHSLGWATIGTTQQHLTGDAELDELTAQAIECDENLQRGTLEEGMRALFTSKRAEVTAKLKAKKNLIEARERKAKADAQVKASADKKAKAEARKELQNAIHASNRAAEMHEKLLAVFSTTEDETANTTYNLPRDTIKEVAKIAGLAPVTISADLTTVRTFGKEVLSLADRIQLHVDGKGTTAKYTSRGELNALKRLKEEYPKEYEIVVNSWRKRVNEGKGAAMRPSTRLAEIAAREASDKRADQANTIDGALEKLAQACSDAKKLIASARASANTASTGLNLKNIPGELRIVNEKLEAIRSLSVQHRNALKKEAAA